MADDILRLLFEFKFRGVSFPVSEFSTDVEQDHVIHKWPDVDGGHVEGTGRAPLVHHATIHFRNGITPGISETWNADNVPLYPNAFRDFLIAMSIRRTGPLQHPELGIVQAKPKNASFKWLANKRDGCDVTASWIESDDTADDFKDVLLRTSPVADAQVFAADVDDQVIQWDNVLVTDDGDESTFSAAITSITSAFDTATLVQYQASGLIDRVLYRIDSLSTRVQKFGDITAWPIVTSCERLASAMNELKQTLLIDGRNIAALSTSQDMTLAALTVATRSSITDLLSLNPTLARSAVVPANTIVRYYKAA
jgi:prophage DNA circulation protein